MKMVFNSEDGYAMLGKYVGVDEGVVLYTATHEGSIRSAPDDCVVVRDVSVAEIREYVERFKRAIDTNVLAWIGDGSDVTLAMNGLVGLAAEAIEYAQIMQAAFTVDAAFTDVRRRARSGIYVGERAHARYFEEPASV